MIQRVYYNNILKKYGSQDQIPYKDLLLTIEWEFKRKLILDRDNEICTNCHQKETITHNYKHFWLETEIRRHEIYNEENETIDSFDEEVLSSSESDKPYHLHVHHKYYVLDKNPWEYPNEALITLCNWCHWEFHKENTVPFYKTDQLLEKLELTPCYRCNGTGSISEYTHVENGICFRCNGAKFEEFIRT